MLVCKIPFDIPLNALCLHVYAQITKSLLPFKCSNTEHHLAVYKDGSGHGLPSRSQSL